jgi:SAM-dependent methyltransferase
LTPLRRLTAAKTWSAASRIIRGRRGFYFSNRGFCVICESEVNFVAEDAWFRDHYRCTRCGSIPRERALMWCLNTWFPDWRELNVHESSPAGRGTSEKLRTQCPGYVSSHYYPDCALGQVLPSGHRNEDLERQTFAAESFDLVVSQDVMEHVLDPGRAFVEIARTLKPGGAHIFTVPLVNKTKPSTPRATREGEAIRHLLPPVFHGNPIDPQGSLVTMDWGYDIIDTIFHTSGLFTSLVYLDRLDLGMRAEYIEVLISRKARP